jgi:hypothetical protein
MALARESRTSWQPRNLHMCGNPTRHLEAVKVTGGHIAWVRNQVYFVIGKK